MKIGSLTIDSLFIQAPLAGYSCAPFRKLVWQWSQPGFCCTEMLSARHIAVKARSRKRYYYKDPAEGLLCMQLAGHQAEDLIIAATQALAWGADLIDLNCGCPQPKIRKKGTGSYLLAQPDKLYRLVKAMKDNSPLPVLVKIRVDGGSRDSFNQEVACAIEQGGADAITVHGRHWTEDYKTPCYLEDIAEVVAAVTIPVIGNGDIQDAASAKKMLQETGCAALMVARASVGQPWLLAEIAAELAIRAFVKPTLEQVGAMFLQHIQGLIALDGEYSALLQSRKLGKYYARGYLQQRECFLAALYQIDNYADLTELVLRHFSSPRNC